MREQNSNLANLVKLLSTDKFIDGNKLGQKLHITRSAVCKAIKKLRSHGVNIISVKGQGYLLSKQLIMYEPLLILQQLNLPPELSQLLDLKIFSSIPSTNDYLKTLALQNKISICLAEEQTKGRGRFARNWYSPFGQNIYLSIGMNFARDISRLMGASLVVGVAVLNALQEYGVAEKFAIKWPNDILWQNKKIAGILIDATAEINGNSKLIVGVGVNLNMTTVEENENLKPWTSIQKITGQVIDKNKMAALLISNIVIYIQKFIRSGLGGFMQQWQEFDYLFGKNITIGSGNVTEVGIGQGIDQQGQLVLQLADGTRKAFSYGDATICKV